MNLLQVIPIVLLLCVLAAIAWGIARDREIFRIHVSGGRAVRVRGRIPQALLLDIQSILGKTNSNGTIVALPEGDRVRLSLKGDFDPFVAQRLRNTVGTFPKAKIKSALPR